VLLVSVVRDERGTLPQFLDHYRRLGVGRFIVVDNGSRDGSADMIAAEFPAPRVRLLRNGVNEGFARANNQGFRHARGRYFLPLNSDTEVRAGALRTMVRFLDQFPGYGACAPRLVNPDGTVQRACMRFPTLAAGFLYDSWFERRFGRARAVRRYFMEEFDHLGDADVDQPPGACFLVRRELFEAIGGFDERLWLFFNDVDLCRQVRARGSAIRYLARAEVLHHGGRSTSQYRDFTGEWIVNRLRYYRKHHGRFGAWVVKAWVLLRALEESARIRAATHGGDRAAALGDLRRVVRRAMAV
jgi:N-acetylglucosaminyl-diphospho-decaprenol L-rhamnosyltransferase